MKSRITPKMRQDASNAQKVNPQFEDWLNIVVPQLFQSPNTSFKVPHEVAQYLFERLDAISKVTGI